MNKASFIEAVATKLGIEEKSKAATTREVERILDGIVEVQVQALKTEGKVDFSPYGSLVTVDVEAKSGTAPNGTKWKKAAHKTIKLRLGTKGKELV